MLFATGLALAITRAALGTSSFLVERGPAVLAAAVGSTVTWLALFAAAVGCAFALISSPAAG